jgi:uroporphyrinogen-III synthase
LTEVREPEDGGAALIRELDHLDRYDWLVVTSVNAARHVGAAAARFASVRLAAVGASTARWLAETSGRDVDFVPSAQRAEGLVAEFRPGPSTILLAQGDLAGSAVADGLRSSGHDVTAVEAYRTVLRQPVGEERDVLDAAAAVVLASGSAAIALADAGGVPGAVVALGPVTADAARDAGLSVAAVAASPADDDVVAAVADAVGHA